MRNIMKMASTSFGKESTTDTGGLVLPVDGRLRGAGTCGTSRTTFLVMGSTRYVCTGYCRISLQLLMSRQGQCSSERRKALCISERHATHANFSLVRAGERIAG